MNKKIDIKEQVFHCQYMLFHVIEIGMSMLWLWVCALNYNWKYSWVLLALTCIWLVGWIVYYFVTPKDKKIVYAPELLKKSKGLYFYIVASLALISMIQTYTIFK